MDSLAAKQALRLLHLRALAARQRNAQQEPPCSSGKTSAWDAQRTQQAPTPCPPGADSNHHITRQTGRGPRRRERGKRGEKGDAQRRGERGRKGARAAEQHRRERTGARQNKPGGLPCDGGRGGTARHVWAATRRGAAQAASGKLPRNVIVYVIKCVKNHVFDDVKSKK